jgi:hypothetical protein
MFGAILRAAEVLPVPGVPVIAVKWATQRPRVGATSAFGPAGNASAALGIGPDSSGPTGGRMVHSKHMFDVSVAGRTPAFPVASTMRRIYVPGPVEGAENAGPFLT